MLFYNLMAEYMLICTGAQANAWEQEQDQKKQSSV